MPFIRLWKLATISSLLRDFMMSGHLLWTVRKVTLKKRSIFMSVHSSGLGSREAVWDFARGGLPFSTCGRGAGAPPEARKSYTPRAKPHLVLILPIFSLGENA